MGCNHNNINCGCKDNYLTTPPACPTPVDCPDPQPCSEVFDAQCIQYTGADILCDTDIVVTQNTSVAQAIEDVVTYFCENPGTPVLADGIQCPEQPLGAISPAGTPFTQAMQDLANYFCSIAPDPVNYQLYRANIIQGGTSFPIDTIFENTLIGVPTLSRTNIGEYLLTLPGGFTLNTHVLVNTYGKNNGIVRAYYQDNNNIAIKTYTTSFVLSDDILENTSIEIKVYS